MSAGLMSPLIYVVLRTRHLRLEWQLPAVTELTQEGPSYPGILLCPGISRIRSVGNTPKYHPMKAVLP